MVKLLLILFDVTNDLRGQGHTSFTSVTYNPTWGSNYNGDLVHKRIAVYMEVENSRSAEEFLCSPDIPSDARESLILWQRKYPKAEAYLWQMWAGKHLVAYQQLGGKRVVTEFGRGYFPPGIKKKIREGKCGF